VALGCFLALKLGSRFLQCIAAEDGQPAPRFIAERVVCADADGIQAGSGERAISPREFAQLLDLADLMGAQFLFRPPLRLLKLKQHRQQ
jgi:hypothetical protein